MNPDQIINMLQSNDIFLTGKAGTGKSYMTREIIKKVKNTIVLASTGMAAVNIGGSTVHSFFKLQICNNITELIAYDNFRINQMKLKNIPERLWHKYMFGDLIDALGVANLIIIDEISMLSKNVLELIFVRLSQFLKKRVPMLVVGDFYQLPPVNGEYAFQSEKWKFIKVELDVVKRTSNVDFANFQSQIRKGEKSDDTILFIESLAKTTVDNPLRIFSRNVDVENANMTHLASLQGEISTIPTRLSPPDQEISKSFLNELRISESFSFKIGARVMIVVNNGNLYNGLLATIAEYNEPYYIRIVTDNGVSMMISKYTFRKLVVTTEKGRIIMKEIASAVQYPLVIAAAITIHKSQGLTIDKLSIDCDRIFEKGQFYVAISRGVNPANINVSSFDKKYITENKIVDEFYQQK